MNPLQNIIKGWITTLIGTAIIIVAVVMIYTSTLPFYWEGAGLILTGAILLIAPDKISGITDAIIKKKTGQ